MMKIPIITPVPGRADKWRLMELIRFDHPEIGPLTVPSGFVFDLASIPRIARSFVQKTDRRTWRASVIHDYLYAEGIGTRSEADDLFYSELRKAGVSLIKSWVMYLAVRVGGWTAWDQQ